MKKITQISGSLLLLCAALNAGAFYDDSFETHQVVTNVMDFGATDNGTNDSDSAAFQATIDYVNANGGGDVEVPAGSYFLKGVQLKSDVHLLIDSGAVLNLESGTMININGDPDWVTNASVQGVGGRFTVNFPQGASGTRFIQVKMARNFLLSDFHVNGNRSSYSSVVMGPVFAGNVGIGMPTQGTMRNASISESSYGYGLIQSQAANSVLFTNLHANGGVALRMETGWDKMGNLQYGGVSNIVGRNLSAENAKSVVMMAPVGLQQGRVDIDGVYATNCARAVSISDGSLRNLYNPDIIPGRYAEGSSVRNVTAVFGTSAQYKSEPQVPDEYTNLVMQVDPDVYGAPWIGPSLHVVNNQTDYVHVSDVRSYGFKYAPPINANGGGLTEETFSSTNYSADLNGDFWSATTNLNPGGTNWISGDGSVGQLDLTTAVAENHALNYWGFALEAGQDASIASDFRYYHQPGGNISGSLGEAAFGLLFSTDPDPASGTNGYCLLGNKGDGLGLVGDALSLIGHTNLNVDTAAGGWSDWFRLKWFIEQGGTNYQGTPLIYNQNGALLYAGPAVDLGLANGTKIWAGYTTGTNGVGGAVSGFSGFDQIEADHFEFETSYINEAPIWVEEPVRRYATLNDPYTFNLHGLVHEPNGRRVKYRISNGPDWLDVDEGGVLTGTPGIFDIGENVFEIIAEDYEGLTATNQLIVSVSSAASGSFALTPVADATVRGGQYADNTGGDGRTLTVQDNTNPDRMREVYMKFDLSQIPGDQITNAFIRLKVSAEDANLVQSVWSVSDDSWQEDTITYSNRPSAVSNLTSSALPQLDWWLELNISSYAQTEWSGDQTLSVALKPTGGWQASYHSKDHMPGYRPELVVQTVHTNNTAPVFSGPVVIGDAATALMAYSSSLTNHVTDADGDTLAFRVLGGPAWLNVDVDGNLTGTPAATNVGVNSWMVQVTDGINPARTAELRISVEANGTTVQSTLYPVADTYVRGGSRSNNNYGTEAVLICKTKSDNENWSYEPYLRFDLTSVAGTSITNATLRLKVNAIDNAASGIATHTAYFISDDSWGETNLTWTTKPALGTALDFDQHPPSVGDWIELDVTRQVEAEWAGDGLLSVALISSNKDKIDYYSREAVSAADRPQLVIQTVGGSTNPAWDSFVSTYGISGSKTNHSDNDGLNDWGEYVIGGNPTNPADKGTLPVFDVASGSLLFSLIGDDSVVARVLTNADLVGGTWGTNGTVTVAKTNGVLGVYTNTVDMSGKELFIKLQLEN